ncbi:MAG: sensor histidine kinase [Akkermansiaceae bacterium]|jgi:signal transduction histidine kinase|nr:HAMP domain-containing histidine kinase [Luteolibacter sp.]
MDKNRPIKSKSASLAVWLVAGFGAFVLAGSIALMAFFQHLTKVEEEVALESLGKANALFLDQSNFPQTKHMADQLGRVMGAHVEFRESTGERSADGRARSGTDLLEVGFNLKNGREVWFSRKTNQPGAIPFWKRLDAQLALGSFWALSLLFSVLIGRKVTRPLAKLAAVIPEIGGDKPLSGLPSSGPQEIVSLANALAEAHGSLVDEREKRRHAERLALLGRMATSLAHEVRNPVAAIRLHAQLLERACETNEKMSATLIVSEAERIEFLVNQWLRYAKPEPVKLMPVDVAALVADACHGLSLQANHAGVVIHQEIAANWQEHEVKGDRDRLRQVLCNLLLNAIQSMPKGGEVTIRVLRGMLEVEDQGVGFSTQALAKFGEPFHSEREGGMGLGVAVSKEIIDSHGAKISVENLPEKGACVRITWPKPQNLK